MASKKKVTTVSKKLTPVAPKTKKVIAIKGKKLPAKKVIKIINTSSDKKENDPKVTIQIGSGSVFGKGKSKEEPIMIPEQQIQLLEGPKRESKLNSRRKIKHIMPPIGTEIVGRLNGKIFKAHIEKDETLQKDHGCKIVSEENPKLIAHSFNQAAQMFTKLEREANGLKDIANGWKWWRRAKDNKRLFDCSEYSEIVG